MSWKGRQKSVLNIAYCIANNLMPLFNEDLKYEIINGNFSNEEEITQ